MRPIRHLSLRLSVTRVVESVRLLDVSAVGYERLHHHKKSYPSAPSQGTFFVAIALTNEVCAGTPLEQQLDGARFFVQGGNGCKAVKSP